MGGTDDLQMFRRLPGIELVKLSATATTAFITPGYVFARPDDGWRGRSYRRYRYRGVVGETGGVELMQFEPSEVASITKMDDSRPPTHTLFVDPAAIARYLDTDALGLPHLARGASADPAILAAFDAVTATGSDDDADPFEHEHDVRQFFALVFAGGTDRPARPSAPICNRAVARAQAIIQDSYGEPLALEGLASSAGVSVFHLERSFSARVGVPLHRYLLLVRIERATKLLRTGTPPAEVAVACGFVDQAHMTRAFRRLFGFTPGAFARRRR